MNPLPQLLVPRRLLLDTPLQFPPERRELDFRRFRDQEAPHHTLEPFKSLLHCAAACAEAHMGAHYVALGGAQFAVEPASQGLFDVFTLAHKKELNLSCNFFRAYWSRLMTVPSEQPRIAPMSL